MNRRKFLRDSGLFAFVIGTASNASFGKKPDRYNYIGMSTVNFRNRFEQTRDKNSDTSGTLSLKETPAYFQDRFGLHLVEFWSRHFESIEENYLKLLVKEIKKAKCTLINIQLDEPYQIGSKDETERKSSVELVMNWIEAAHRLGSGAIRVNPGNGDPDLAIESLRAINEQAKKYGIVMMTENHFGMEMDPDVHLRIVQSVGENMYTLPDYGNYDDDVRFDYLNRIMPYAYQVSAKTMDFDEQGRHLSFDFDKCMEIARDSGFKGIYSVEQWSRTPGKISDEKMADWMISKVLSYV